MAELDLCRDVSFAIPGRKKVGIVGRTGAGKSSLIAALFRIVEPYSGRLLIDGVNILDLPLQDVRRSIAIVPQVSEHNRRSYVVNHWSYSFRSLLCFVPL